MSRSEEGDTDGTDAAEEFDAFYRGCRDRLAMQIVVSDHALASVDR